LPASSRRPARFSTRRLAASTIRRFARRAVRHRAAALAMCCYNCFYPTISPRLGLDVRERRPCLGCAVFSRRHGNTELQVQAISAVRPALTLERPTI
jgi:hypothetical protein